MNHLTRTIEVCELVLPSSRKLLIHSESKKAAMDNSAPWKVIAAVRIDKLHEPRPQFRPPRSIRGHDIEKTTNLVTADFGYCEH